MPEPIWYLLESGRGAAAENMAIDEALLQHAAQIGQPLLRFYAWTKPAATFGYFQAFHDVEKLTQLRPLIRRPTGGGLVPHDADWTYSVVFPPGHWWYELKAVESYRQLHEWVLRAFARSGLATELATVPKKGRPGQCFAAPEQFDLVCSGQKIAGAAQRRSRQGLLIQGSIQPPQNLKRHQWEQGMREAASQQWKIRWQTFALPPAIAEQVRALAEAKYSRADYNQKR